MVKGKMFVKHLKKGQKRPSGRKKGRIDGLTMKRSCAIMNNCTNIAKLPVSPPKTGTENPTGRMNKSIVLHLS